MTTKFILVGGYIPKAVDGGNAFCEELVKDFHRDWPVKILDCMFARPKESWDEKFTEDTIFFSKFVKDFKLELAQPEKFIEQIQSSDVIFLRGGYSDVLLNILHTCGDWAHGLDGKVVAGTSAGAEILSKYSYNLDTSELSENLGLLPIKFIPHWQSDYKDIKNNSVDWKKVYHELKNYKEDLEIVTLREGEFKVYENITV